MANGIQPGQVVGSYRIEHYIGHGGFGVVWKAHHEHLDIPVAIKVIDIHQLAPADLERIKRECRIGGQLTHKMHVVEVRDAFPQDDRFYIVMELMADSLDAYLRQHPHPDFGLTLDWALGLCSALKQVHDLGFVHRDIKPQNILLTQDGQARLSDFGVAHLPDSGLTTSFQPGTRLYAAPEQETNQPVDGGADVYALCAVLFEVWSGQKYAPFRNQDRSIVHEEMAFLLAENYADLLPDLRVRLMDVVLAGLRPRPERISLPDLESALRAVLAAWKKARTDRAEAVPGVEPAIKPASALAAVPVTVPKGTDGVSSATPATPVDRLRKRHVLTWQKDILAHFAPKRERMLLVIDPDDLMRDEALLAEVQNSNYDVLELGDEVTFRNHFERTYRSRWDSGEALHVVIVVHTTDGDRHIPYDLWAKSKRIDLSVGALFPNLNAIVVSQLDNAYYADLYPAHQRLVARNEMLRGERQTIEFILRVVFGLDPAGASDPARWIEFLTHKHYGARELPPALEDYVVKHLLSGVAGFGFRAELLSDADAFYVWLGQVWADYVALVGGYGTPPSIDLADARLRPLLGYLFAEGLVARTTAPSDLPPDKAWMVIGLAATQRSASGQPVREDPMQRVYNLQARLARFREMDEATLPSGKTDLRDWLNLANEWAEVVYQANSLPTDLYEQVQPDLAATRESLDTLFYAFVQARYSAVDYYQDNKGPICLTAVNRWLYQQHGAEERLALLCFDGLALDQWFLLRDVLNVVLPGLSFQENRAYAVAPTVTPVSRQALFAGRLPAEFTETLQRTDQDAARWRAYWVNKNVPERRVAWVAAQINGRGLDELRTLVASKNRRLGVLVNLFDQVMHAVKGMPAQADKRVYYDTLRSHLQNGRLADLFNVLLDGGYHIYLTADHGNIAGVGRGLKPPKALLESYASRVVLFDQAALADEFALAHHLRAFRTKSLPPDLHPVYASGTQLFAAEGATQISHGGLSLEELVVPFVEIKR